MDIDRVVPRQVVAELADGLEERQALDVADRAADLDQHEIELVIALEHEFLDRVGDVRDHLHGGAEIVAAPLLGDDVGIDAAGRDVVALVGVPAGEALVVAEIEVGLGPVIGDEHLAVLGGRHRARVDVEVGVELAQADLVAARLQHRAECRGGQTLAERGNHASGDENVPSHGPSPYGRPLLIRKPRATPTSQGPTQKRRRGCRHPLPVVCGASRVLLARRAGALAPRCSELRWFRAAGCSREPPRSPARARALAAAGACEVCGSARLSGEREALVVGPGPAWRCQPAPPRTWSGSDCWQHGRGPCRRRWPRRCSRSTPGASRRSGALASPLLSRRAASCCGRASSGSSARWPSQKTARRAPPWSGSAGSPSRAPSSGRRHCHPSPGRRLPSAAAGSRRSAPGRSADRQRAGRSGYIPSAAVFLGRGGEALRIRRASYTPSVPIASRLRRFLGRRVKLTPPR